MFYITVKISTATIDGASIPSNFHTFVVLLLTDEIATVL
jgi:hypothetical protein